MNLTVRGRLIGALLCLVALAGVLLLGIVAGRRLGGRGSAFAESGSVALPPRPTGPVVDATRAYLAAEGMVVAGLTQVTAPMVQGSPAPADCRTVAESALPGLGTPAEVYRAFAAIPDQPTAEIAVAHLDATTRFLARCLKGDIDQTELRFTRTVLLRRLEEVS